MQHVRVLIVTRDHAEGARWADAARDAVSLHVTPVTTLADAVDLLPLKAFDAALVSYELPDGAARELLRAIATDGDEVSAIVIGSVDHDAQTELIELGAVDIMHPNEIDRVGPALSRALRMATLARTLRQTRTELHEIREHGSVDGAHAVRIAHLSSHDALTDLPNRPVFEARLAAAIATAESADRRTGVILIDMDRFKAVNELGSHSVGDEVIRSTAFRLRRMLGENDALARFGGDKFVVLIADAENAAQVLASSDAMIAAVREPFHVGEREFFITASAGISVFPEDASDVPTLITTAETAMYDAKRMGRNMTRPYAPAMLASPTERLSLQRDLQTAIERDELELYYQPMYDVETRSITGVEALLRWRHPTRGMLLPDRFIPIAEESGAIEPIGNWVIARACEQIRAWSDIGVPNVRVSINVSARQLESSDLLDRIYEQVQRNMIDPSSLEIEVTESSIMRDVPAAIRLLCDLKEIGFRVSIDDFGTGYTSLRFLKRCPIDVLKIDRSFIREVATGVFDGAVVRAVTTLARSLGVSTIAEGVELESQFERLKDLQCDEVQGFLLSVPLTSADCTPLLLAPLRSIV